MKETIIFTIDKKQKEKLIKKAKDLGLTLSSYIRLVLNKED